MKAEEILKPSELRLGNQLQNGVVVGLTKDTITVFDGYSTWPSDKMKEPFEPIPLTPEILDKAGFRKDVLGYHIVLPDRFNNYKELSVAYNNDDSTPKYYTYYREAGKLKDDRSGDSLVQLLHDLQYLHQLQNLYFALTSSELPINL